MAIETFADGVPESASAILVDVYQQAARRIQEAVIRPMGKTADAQAFRRARAAELSMQIDQVLVDVRSFTVRWTAQGVADAFALGHRTAIQQATAAGLRGRELPVQGGFSRVDRRTIAVIAADMAVSLDNSLTSQARSAQRFLRASAQRVAADSELSRVIAQGAISGDVRQTVRDMRGLLNAAQIEDYRKAGQQLIDVGRATLSVAKYAEMVVRTRTRQATVQARSERLVANGLELVMIVGRPSENFCSAYLGRVFSITGRSREYPSLGSLPSGGPPFHPNCSKSTRAYVARFATAEQQRLSHMTDDRFITADADEAQRIFDKKDELRNVMRRYRTVA